MKAKQNLFNISLIVLVIWTAIIIIGNRIITGGSGSLEDLVKNQVNIAFIVAPLFLFGVVAYFRWQRPVGLKAAEPARSWLIL